MTKQPSGFLGWLADPGPPFRQPLLVPYLERPIVLIGPNGCGKTRLLRALVDRCTARLYSSPPRRLAPYLTMERQRIEERQRPAELSDRELFEAAEAIRATDDAEAWWRQRFARPALWWTVRLSDGSAQLAAVDPDDPFTELAGMPVATRHASHAIEPWITPDTTDLAALHNATAQGFRAWSAAVLHDVTLYANPLVATPSDGQAVSLLAMATAYCAIVADRAATRLQTLVGFPLLLRCRAAEDFTWHAQVDGDWIDLVHTSRAMSGWCTLAVTETLRELLQCATEAAGDARRSPDRALLNGVIDPALVPPGPPGPFATRSTWVALDEPEVHLFPSEARVLADALAGRGSMGRTLIATHSLDLAARFVGTADFHLFDGPGRTTFVRPEGGIATLLRRLSAQGPAILTHTRILYVEGDWDVELVERLHGPSLAAANVLVSRMQGVKGAGIAAASVWQRMIATPFGMMFDGLRATEAASTWARTQAVMHDQGREAALSRLRAELRTVRGRHEQVELIRLFHAVLEGCIESRLRLVMHGLSDIFQVVHPSVFGLDERSWADAGYDSRSSLKAFCQRTTGIDLTDGRQCRRILDAFDAASRPVDKAAATALAEAIDAFVAG